MPKKQKVPPHIQEALRQQAVKGEIKQPDLARLTAAFFERAGGERNVANFLYEEFAASPPGGIVRQRILDMILRHLKWVNEKNAPVDDLGTLSDEDLDRELAQLIEVVGGENVNQQAPGQPAGPAGSGAQEGGPSPSSSAAAAPSPAGRTDAESSDPE